MESIQAVGAGVDLRQETDEDLLVYMTMRDDDSSIANAAWAEFYQRHLQYLYRCCCRLSRGILDEAGARDLVQDTFIRAFNKAATFNGDRIIDPDRLKRRTRAWLGRIALNIFRDMLRGRDGTREVPLDDNDIGAEPELVQSSPSTSANRLLLDEAIDSLSEREQIVLRTTFQYYQPGKQNQHLPHDVVEDLAKSLETTSDNVRQIRSRALRKINQHIKSKADSKNS
ncbi:MAG: RNA polymerase sigma factor [Pyrinomonadaceae bacterium]